MTLEALGNHLAQLILTFKTLSYTSILIYKLYLNGNQLHLILIPVIWIFVIKKEVCDVHHGGTLGASRLFWMEWGSDMVSKPIIVNIILNYFLMNTRIVFRNLNSKLNLYEEQNLNILRELPRYSHHYLFSPWLLHFATSLSQYQEQSDICDLRI